MVLKIKLRKLIQFMNQSGEYEYNIDEDVLNIKFKPTNPDALSMYEGEPATIQITCKIDGEYAFFTGMKIIGQGGEQELDDETIEHFLGPWVEVIDLGYE